MTGILEATLGPSKRLHPLSWSSFLLPHEKTVFVDCSSATTQCCRQVIQSGHLPLFVICREYVANLLRSEMHRLLSSVLTSHRSAATDRLTADHPQPFDTAMRHSHSQSLRHNGSRRSGAAALAQRGQGMTEFIIVTVLVAIVVLVAVRLFGKSVSCEFNDASNQINDGTTSVSDDGCVRGTDEAFGGGIGGIGGDPPRPSPAPLPSIEPPPASPPPPSPNPSPSASPVPEFITFDNPTLGGAPLDNCYNFGKNCGTFAAEIFCQSQGLSKSVSFSIGATKVPKTYILGDGTYCDFPPPQPPFCQPFTQIVCQK